MTRKEAALHFFPVLILHRAFPWLWEEDGQFRTLVWKVNCRDIYQGDNFIHMHSLIGSKLDKIAPRGRIPQISWRSCRGQPTMSQRPHLDSHLLLYCWNVTAQDAAAPAQCHLSKRSLRVPVNARLDRKHRMFHQPTRQRQLWALYWFPRPLLTSHFPFFLLPYSSSSESFLPSAEVPSFLVFENGNCSLGSIESTWLLSPQLSSLIMFNNTELKTASVLLNGWKSFRNGYSLVTHENYMKFKFQCPLIQFHWDSGTHVVYSCFHAEVAWKSHLAALSPSRGKPGDPHLSKWLINSEEVKSKQANTYMTTRGAALALWGFSHFPFPPAGSRVCLSRDSYEIFLCLTIWMFWRLFSPQPSKTHQPAKPMPVSLPD